MKKIMSFLIISVFCVFSVIGSSFAQSTYVYADLASSYTQVKKGEPFYIGLYTEIQSHWHTYWKNPGDSGLETQVTFDPVAGVEIGDIIWPTPKKIPFQGLLNYGYEDDVLYLIPVTIDESFKGEELILKAQASWLVCKEVCIPENDDLELTLSVGESFVEGVNKNLFETHKSKLPQEYTGTATAKIENGKLVASFDPIKRTGEEIYLFPYEWGVLDYIADQKTSFNDTSLTVSVSSPAKSIDKPIKAVLDTGDVAYAVNILPNEKEMMAVPVAPVDQEQVGHNISLAHILFYAFLGGLILNLMPCVFPVLSLKAMSLIGHAEKHPAETRKQALFYLAGVVVSFLVVGGSLLLFQYLGHEVGWGFQLQSATFTALMAILFFVIGMNLTGLFEIGTSLMNVGSNKTGKDQSSFLTGVLAVIVATPCSAPFMATALGAVLWLGAVESLVVFLFLGLGLAFPYVLISFSPPLIKYLPRPGAWMETFKQFLSFPMFASSLWLLYVVLSQAGALAVLATLGVSFLIVFMLWVISKPKHIITYPLVILTLVASVFVFKTFIYEGMSATDTQQNTSYIAYDEAVLAQLRAENKPVFVNMTADWCITCLANERIALSDERVGLAFQEKGITYMKGDWTNQDASITRFLKNYDRNGVPLYVFYDTQGDVEILPQLLTVDTVLEIINK